MRPRGVYMRAFCKITHIVIIRILMAKATYRNNGA